MPPRKANDPFNFDDVYQSLGADNLVKKSMGEMKKAAAGTGSSTHVPHSGSSPALSKLTDSGGYGRSSLPGASTTAPVPGVSTVPSRATVQLPPGSLDFLTGGAKPGNNTTLKPAGYSMNSKPSTIATSKGSNMDFFSDFTSSSSAKKVPQTALSQAASCAQDPFAMFDDVPGIQPVQQPSAKPAASTVQSGFSGFEDIAVEEASTHKPAAPVEVQQHQQPSLQTNSKSLGSSAVHLTADHASTSGDFGSFESPKSFGHTQAPITSGSYSAFDANSSPAGSGYASPAGLPRTRSPPILPVSQPASNSAYNSQVSTRNPAYGSRLASKPQASKPSFYDESETYHNSSNDMSSDGGYANSASAGSKAQSTAAGVVGFMRGLGKKAVKAAQAGLQSLETALEKMEGSQTQQQQQSTAYQSSSSSSNQQQPYRHGYQRSDSPGSYGYQSKEDEQRKYLNPHNDLEDPSAIALTLLALPSEERDEALATIPAVQRKRVKEILSQLCQGEEHVGLQSSAERVLSVDIKTSAVDLSAWDSESQPAPAPMRHHQTTTYVSSPKSQSSPKAPSNGPLAGYQSLGREQVFAASNVHDTHDLLGVSDGPAVSSKPAAAMPSVQAPVLAPEEDLLGMASPAGMPAPSFSNDSRTSQQTSAPSAPQPAVSAVSDITDVDDMHDFFSGGPAANAAAPASSSSTKATTASAPVARTSQAAAVPKPAAKAADSLMDLSGWDAPDVDVTAHSSLYEDNEGEAGEPELRRQLRAARLAEKHAKMKAALAGKQAQEAEEARQREEQQALKQQYKGAIEAWKNKNKGNIRGLLSSVQTVLWEDSGWKPVGMADLLEPAQIRKVWMRVNLLVHPDKVRQRSGSPEQVARADMIFDVIKDAWNGFQTGGK